MGDKTDRLPAFSAKIKNECSYICGVCVCFRHMHMNSATLRLQLPVMLKF